MPISDHPGYPAGREVDVALRDGHTVHVRPVRCDDEPGVHRFLSELSVEARAFRFFTAAADVEQAAAAAVGVDYVDAYGVIALAGSDVVGHACFARTGPDRAEVAFAIADRVQGTGIATVLLAHLVEAAQPLGIHTFVAVVLPSNQRMIAVFRESGLRVAVRSGPGELHLEMAATLDAEAQQRFAERDKVAAAAGVRRVLEPRSIAVVGVSERPGSIGGTVVQNLVAVGYTGTLSVIHPRAERLHGVPAHRSVGALPEPPDLVVIAVPFSAVTAVAREAAEAGASALVVISAGFREAGPEGAAREQELLAICRASGMRLVGPNCLGVINTDPQVALDATFAPRLPAPGNVALLSQSGALGIAAIEAAHSYGIGLSSFVSVGNKADLSGNDFLQYWEDDGRTGLVMLYLESFGNPRKFARIAQRIGRHKPVVVVKAGRSLAGARAAQSHTGALLASSDATVDALCTQAGVVRVDTLSELFDVAALLSRQPSPRGARVGILTNGGGVGILCADACEAAGLDVVELSEELRGELASEAGAGAAVRNPVDLLGGSGTQEFTAAAGHLVRAGEVDALIVLAVATPSVDPSAVALALDALTPDPEHPVTLATVLMPLGTGTDADPPIDHIPRFAFPEQAAKAVARAARHGAWLTAAHPVPVVAAASASDAGSAIIAAALSSDTDWLTPEDTRRLLELHGVPMITQHAADGPQEAARGSELIDGPVALKAVAPGLVHKSDAGAVALGLTTPADVARAAEAMLSRLAGQGHEDVSFLVQAMAGPGAELLVGAVHDPSFGPVVVCAAGGTTAEILHDTATRLAPLDPAQAAAMLRELRTFPLLTGYRDTPPCDVAAIEQVIVAVAALVDAHPEVVELDLNPIIAGPGGATVVDARIRIEPVPAPSPAPSLRADWP